MGESPGKYHGEMNISQKTKELLSDISSGKITVRTADLLGETHDYELSGIVLSKKKANKNTFQIGDYFDICGEPYILTVTGYLVHLTTGHIWAFRKLDKMNKLLTEEDIDYLIGGARIFVRRNGWKPIKKSKIKKYLKK